MYEIKKVNEKMKKVADKYQVPVSIPDMKYCTDNAAMIGAAAYPLFLQNKFVDFTLNAKSQAPIVEK